MPEMTGAEVISESRRHRSELDALVISSATGMLPGAVDGVAFLLKLADAMANTAASRE